MSVLSSTYYEDITDLDRYGEGKSDYRVTLHVAASFYEHVHVSIDTHDAYSEVNMTIETAEAMLAGLEAAIESARKGRNLRK
jgi:S-adenosylmethionine:tRNA-ribosyltransferase-isomerase (queuine synthetase)